MVARLNRPRPLPEAVQPRVLDTKTQQAFDLLFVPLREVIRFLQPQLNPVWYPFPEFSTNPLTAISGSGSKRAEYMKDHTGRVWFRGSLEAVTTLSTPNLPAGFRPAGTIRIPFCTSTGTIDFLRINSDGATTFGTTMSNAHLEGISFAAES